MTRLLRLVAFAIAIAGVVDPAITLSGASRARVALVALRSAPPAADGVRDRLVRDLSASYEIVPQLTSDAAAAIVIGDRYPDDPTGRSADAVARRAGRAADRDGHGDRGGRAGVRIVRVDAPRDVPPATAIHLDVEVEGLRRRGTDDRRDRARSRASRSAARRIAGRRTTSAGTRPSTRFRSASRRMSCGSG